MRSVVVYSGLTGFCCPIRQLLYNKESRSAARMVYVLAVTCGTLLSTDARQTCFLQAGLLCRMMVPEAAAAPTGLYPSAPVAPGQTYWEMPDGRLGLSVLCLPFFIRF